MMTLDEAIIHAEEVAEEHTKYNRYGGFESCDECAEEHRQLAKWLRELKQIKREIPEIASETKEILKSVQTLRICQKWIPVSERLPKNNGVYLVTTFFDIDETESGRDVTKAYFCSPSKKWQYFSNDEVIAWMPLPEPYKESEEQKCK